MRLQEPSSHLTILKLKPGIFPLCHLGTTLEKNNLNNIIQYPKVTFKHLISNTLLSTHSQQMDARVSQFEHQQLAAHLHSYFRHFSTETVSLKKYFIFTDLDLVLAGGRVCI